MNGLTPIYRLFNENVESKKMFSEAVRRYGFWFIDALGGRDVKKYFLDLEKKIQKRIDTSSEDLQKLLSHAVNTTAFYRNFRGFSGIRDFPVMKKSVIRKQYDDFISLAYKNQRLHKMHTSGSTGERFTVLQDRQKRKRVIAELIYFYEQCGFRPGDRYVDVRTWHKDNKKTKPVQLAENLVMFDCSSLSDESLHKLYRILRKDHTIKCLTGYANSLLAIALYFDKRGYTPDMFSIKVVVSTSERLEAGTKNLLRKVFGCPVVSRYSNNENGVLAQQPVNGDDFILNTAHYMFETLRLDADEPAFDGEPARLVLTDLYNYAMPLIRYDTGDIVIMENSDGDGFRKKHLTEISGRCDEIIYDTRGNKIHHQYLALHLERYDKFSQFQLIQESLKNFILKLEGNRDFYDDNDIRNTIGKIVGHDAVIKIEHVNNIPRLSSGKFKRIICNYKADRN